MHLLDHEFTVLGFTETWLKDDDCGIFGIPGYAMVEKHRTVRPGGGVAVCIKDHLEYSVRDDISVFSDCMEAVFIEMNKEEIGISKNIVIGVI